MANAPANDMLKGIPFTMDSKVSDSAKFHIDALVGLDMMVKLLPAAAVYKVQVKTVEGIVVVGLGDKFLPLELGVLDGGVHEKPTRKLCTVLEDLPASRLHFWA